MHRCSGDGAWTGRSWCPDVFYMCRFWLCICLQRVVWCRWLPAFVLPHRAVEKRAAYPAGLRWSVALRLFSSSVADTVSRFKPVYSLEHVVRSRHRESWRAAAGRFFCGAASSGPSNCQAAVDLGVSRAVFGFGRWRLLSAGGRRWMAEQSSFRYRPRWSAAGGVGVRSPVQYRLPLGRRLEGIKSKKNHIVRGWYQGIF